MHLLLPLFRGCPSFRMSFIRGFTVWKDKHGHAVSRMMIWHCARGSWLNLVPYRNLVVTCDVNPTHSLTFLQVEGVDLICPPPTISEFAVLYKLCPWLSGARWVSIASK